MSFKERLTQYKNRLTHFFTRFIKNLASRWRSLTPGFRYAIVYFICVVCIASVIWWQFNPGSSLVFDPEANLEPEPSEEHHQIDPNDSPGNDDDQEQNAAAFSPEQGDKLRLPMQGEILASFEQPFWELGLAKLTEGIHIDGTAGDPVCAAWQGVVHSVTAPDPMESGEVWLKHGDWFTVYKNIEEITVSEGQTIQAGQMLGVLSASLTDAYTGDYLEFQLWSNGDVVDPWEYAGVER